MQLTQNQIDQIYFQAQQYFSSIHPDWTCYVDQGSFIVALNWENTTYFGGLNVSMADRSYRHIIKINADGTFTATDVHDTTTGSAGAGGLNMNKSVFIGESRSFHKEITFGRDNNTGNMGINTYTLNTATIQKPVQEYFLNLGLQQIFPIRMWMGLGFLILMPLLGLIGLLFAKNTAGYLIIAFSTLPFLILGLVLVLMAKKRMKK